MAKPDKKTEVTDLEDLQVKEVSIVDHPANLRTFLIVKRATEDLTMAREAFAAGDDTGDHEVEEQDEETEDVIKDAAEATAEAAEEDADAIDLLELTEDEEDDEEEDEEEEEPDPEGEIQEILKAVTVAQAFKPLNAALGQLMKATNEVKKLGKKALTKEVTSKLRVVMLALNMISGKGKVKTEKAEGGAIAVATASLQKLMTLVNTLKGMKQTDAFPGKLASEAKAIAGSISGMLATSPTAASKKKQKAEAQVSKAEGTDDNPIVIIKAGSKMKKTRLAKLREAVTLLSSILKELEGDKMTKKEDEAAKTEDAKEEKKADKVEKAEDEAKTEAKPDTSAEAIKEGFAKLGEAINGLGDKLEDITKRVGDLEGTAPEGNAEPDPPEEVKKAKNIWDNVIPNYPTR